MKLTRNQWIALAVAAAVVVMSVSILNQPSSSPPSIQGFAFSATDTLPCTSADNQAKARASWDAAGGGRDNNLGRAGQANETFFDLNQIYETSRTNYGLLWMAIACSDDGLIQSIAESWNNLPNSAVQWDPGYGQPAFLSWQYRGTGPAGPCTGGVPSGNRCDPSGNAFTPSTSTDCQLCISGIIYLHSVILDYIAKTASGSRAAWTTAYVAKWKPFVLNHLEHYIMRSTWTYNTLGTPCTANALAPYGSSTTGKTQMFARYAVNNWGTGAQLIEQCNAMRDNDYFQAAAGAEYLQGNVADAALLPYSGTGITLTLANQKTFVSVVKNWAIAKATSTSLTNFSGGSVSGLMLQKFSDDASPAETGWAGDTNAAYPPTCIINAPNTTSQSATFTSGSSTVTVASTANIMPRSRIFGTVMDDGTTPGQSYYVGEILSSTTYRMDKTLDYGRTSSPGLSTTTGARTISYIFRTFYPPTGVGEDTSHYASSLFFVLTSWRGTNSISGMTDPLTDTYMLQTANQFAYGIGNKDTTYPKFSNFTSGQNGWYRTNYYSGDYLAGYEPYESGTVGGVKGWFWFGTYNSDIYTYASRWKTIWEATSGADYTWRVVNLAAGGTPRWGFTSVNPCVRDSATTFNTNTNNSYGPMMFYPSLVDGGINAGGGGATTTTTTLVPTTTTTTIVPGNDACPGVCLFAANATPSAVAGGDNVPFAYGFRFTVSDAGTINYVRYYRPSGDVSTRTIEIRDGSGTLLGTTTASVTTQGWRNVAITPINVSPGTAYFVAVSAGTNAAYPYTYDVFTSAVTSGALTAPADQGSGQPVRNGLYGSLGAVLTSSYRSTSYSVDVSYAAAPPPTTTTTSTTTTTTTIPGTTTTTTTTTTIPTTTTSTTSTTSTTTTTTTTAAPTTTSTTTTIPLTGTPCTGGLVSFTSISGSGNTSTLTDKNESTLWTAGATPVPLSPQVITLDLGTTRVVNEVRFAQKAGRAARVFDVTLRSTPTGAYYRTTRSTFSTGGVDRCNILKVSPLTPVRYISINLRVMEPSGTGLAPQLYEIGVA